MDQNIQKDVLTIQQLLFFVIDNQCMMLQILSGMITPENKSKELFEYSQNMREEFQESYQILQEIIKRFDE